MKKILLLSLFALMASISQAQIWVGGSLGIKVDDDKKKTTISLSISPELGISLNSKWDIAVGITEVHTNYNPDIGNSYSANYLSINPFTRYTIAEVGLVSFFVDGGFIIGTGDYDGFENKTDWAIGLRPGIKLIVSSHLALTARLGYFGYRYEGEPDRSTFGMGVDNSNISFGGYYTF